MANSKSAAQDALVIAHQILDDHAFGRRICCYEAMTLKLCRALVASAAREDKLRFLLEEWLRDFGGNEDSDSKLMCEKTREELAGGSDGK